MTSGTVPGRISRKATEVAVMNTAAANDGVSLSYVHDDERQRCLFDRQLAAYVRRHSERWDLTAIVEPLELLGRRAGQVGVDIHRQPDGALSVTVQFELPPYRA
jgi:hypothetical protein